jgi:glycosyltransferase involved in cell wall biosynthesis
MLETQGVVSHLTSVHSASDIRIFRKQCLSLVKAGYNVAFVVPLSQDDIPESTVKLIRIPRFSDRLRRFFLTPFWVFFAAIEQKSGIYHFHDPELIPIGLLLKTLGKKVIYDVHEDVPRQILSKYWIPQKIRGLVSWLVEKLENFSVKIFDAVVAATPHIEQRFKPIAKKTSNINNYPVLGELEAPECKLKDSAFAYVGGVTAVRGLLEMVQAMDLVDAQLLIAGKFAGVQLKEKAAQTPGWQNVTIMGHLDRPQVADLLSRSAAGLVLFHPEPNHVNAQPNKMFEYMSAGLPVIASNFPLWKEIIEGNKCGICVDPLNVSEIAQAMQWILDNPEQAKEMGENGYRAVVEKYNWDVEAIKLKKLYQDLL